MVKSSEKLNKKIKEEVEFDNELFVVIKKLIKEEFEKLKNEK